MALKIADMSQFNTVTNWDELKKSVDGTILRMGYRGSHTGEITYDPKFVEYIYKIKEYKIPYSVYFFPCSISDAEADEEADFIIETIKNYDLKLALPVYLDSEIVQPDRSGRSDKLSPARRTQYLNRIMKKLQDKNIPYGVYASTSWYNNQLNDKDLLAGCSRWVAQYNSECTYNNYPYDLWQYTSKGSIKGVSGNIDLSHCYCELDLVENKEELEPQTPTEPVKPVEPKKVKITEADCINKLIEIAKEEVGYLEKRNGNLDYLYTKTQNAGSANYTKYGYELHQLQPKNMDYPAFWCFPKGTLVLTDNGYKDISEIVLGDKVLSADGTHFNTVVRTTNHEDNIYETKYIGGLSLQSTGDHPVYSKKRLHVRKDAGFTIPTFNSVKELKKGDSLAMTITKMDNQTDLSYNEAWLIGYYVGDGWHDRNGYTICGNDKKCIEIEQHTDNLLKEKMYKSRTCQHYRIGNNYNKLFPILDDCGYGAWNKRVPAKILYSNNNIKQAFLDGYLTADGFIMSSPAYLGYNTVSIELAMGINKIAVDLGYGTSLRKQKRKGSYTIFDPRYEKYREIKVNDIYYGAINTFPTGKHNSCEVSNGYSYHTIRNVSDTHELNIVYNIETDGDHTYVANNIAVHNCDSFTDWIVLQVVNRLGFTMAEAKKVLCGDFDDYTVYSANHYKKKGRWYTSNPKVGDQIFFKNSSGICHTGIVYKVDSSKVYTIEGNTSGASGVVSNGGGVAMKSYARNYSGIAGYGRMDWSCIVGKEIIVDNNTTNTNNNTNNKVTSIKATSKSEFAISKTGSPSKNKVFIGKVTASALNVRSWAGTNNKTVSFSPLKKGIEVIVCDAILAKDGSNWYYIKYNGKYGFVSSAYITYVRA